nr:beta-ketoacyl synthase N-terminal-like domain-containing protein [uncultured Desulfuromonas sp.]
MKNVVITHASAVTGLGTSLDAIWTALLAGHTAIAEVKRFDTDHYLAKVAACVPDLTADVGGSRLYPLLDQLLDQLPRLPEDARLFTATTKGAIDLLEQGRRDGLEAAQLQASLPVTMTRWVAQQLACNDPGQNVNAACASSTQAIARGAALIAYGQARCVVVVCADLVSEFVLSGFSALQALSRLPSRPFDVERSGLTLGEGAAAVVLMDEDTAKQNGLPTDIELCGWGIANDANHITAPARDGCGLILAVEQALTRAGLNADQVAAISAHGTGTVYNDMMELTAFQALFGDRELPINSIKGALGHTLGAAGGLEAALALPALRERRLPPTCGLVQAEPLAGERVKNVAQSFTGDVLLSTNSGFGGVNAALLLKRRDA